jgi:hypothetical protein
MNVCLEEARMTFDVEMSFEEYVECNKLVASKQQDHAGSTTSF